MLLLTDYTPPNRYLIHVSRMMLLAECISAKPFPIHVSCMMLFAECVSAKSLPDPGSHLMLLAECILAKPLPDLCQLHYVARSVVRSMSIDIVSLTVLSDLCQRYDVARRVVLAKLLPDLCQPHDVARRVCLSNRYLIYVILLAECVSATPFPIYVNCMMLLAECTRQIGTIYVSCSDALSRMMLLAECVSAKPLPDPCQHCLQSAPHQIGT